MYQVLALKKGMVYEIGFVEHLHEALAIQLQAQDKYERVWIADLAMEFFCG